MDWFQLEIRVTELQVNHTYKQWFDLYPLHLENNLGRSVVQLGGGPRVVVSTAAFHAGFGSRSRRFERNKIVSSPSTCES